MVLIPLPCGRCGNCLRCRLIAKGPQYAALFGLPGPPPPSPPPPPPGPEPRRTVLPALRICRHEGRVVTFCETCAGPEAEARHVRNCDVHGLVTRGPNAGGTGSCAGCAEFAAADRPTPSVRHLLYHVYPLAGNGAWQANVDALVRRLGLFNGRIVVAIATDSPRGRVPDPTGFGAPDEFRQFTACDSPAAVRERFGPHADRIEFLECGNDSLRREVQTFELLFSRVADLTDPEHATLYAHAKGVTRPPGHIAHHWARVMSEVYLDYWPLVARQLRRHPITGAFKKVGRAWPAEQSLSDWHYSGSWLWFRNADLFARPDWRRTDPFWGGIESYPSLHFTPEEAGCLFHERPGPEVNLYDEGYWSQVVDPDLATWRRENTGLRTTTNLPACRRLNIGCGPFYAPDWHNTDLIRTDEIRPDEVTGPELPLPWPDGHFERAFLGHVLEHVPWEGVVALLRDVRRVVRPGGEVLVVGPDLWRSLDRLLSDPDRPGAMAFVAGVIEDDEHHQDDAGRPVLGARHQWNCYEARVVRALVAAGFSDVRPVPLDPDVLAGWPVVDFTNPWQCVVLGRVP